MLLTLTACVVPCATCISIMQILAKKFAWGVVMVTMQQLSCYATSQYPTLMSCGIKSNGVFVMDNMIYNNNFFNAISAITTLASGSECLITCLPL